MLVSDQAARAEALRLLGLDAPIRRIPLHLIPTNDAWVRDYGPTMVTRIAPTLGLPPAARRRLDFQCLGRKVSPLGR